MIDAHQHDHEHDNGAVPHTHLTSVGIDIGSSTSHLMFSELAVGYPSFHDRRPQVLSRRVLSRSPILLTPFSVDWSIDASPLRELIFGAFSAAGLSPDQVDTGAVIVTGEAARRDNAQRIAELFSDLAGRFVCATAGPRLEGLMAAHGSGAVAHSRERGQRVLHVDIGGGTTKINLVERGRVVETTAINIGARLIAHDESNVVVRKEHAGDRFLTAVGHRLAIGDTVTDDVLDAVAARMAQTLFDGLEGRAAPWDDFYVMEPIPNVPSDVGGVLFSGGVSEYIYGREPGSFGDLGPNLGREVRRQAEKRGYPIIEAGEGIRATVIGASAYSMQLSGETIFIPEPERLPLHGLRIFVVPVTWDAPVAERAEMAVLDVLSRRDPEVVGTPYALAVVSPPFYGYGVTQELAEGLRRAIVAQDPIDRPDVLVFEQNIGQVIGATIASDLKIACIDEVTLSELDFIDLGRIVEGESYVPVVVKSLAFGF